MKQMIAAGTLLALASGCAVLAPPSQDTLPPAQEIVRDASGRTTVHKEYNPDGTLRSTTTYFYDKTGRLTFQKTISPQKNGGRIESEFSFSPRSGVSLRTDKIYDAAGKLMDVRYFSNQPDKIHKLNPSR